MASLCISDAEFQDLRDLIHRLFGIDLSPDKKELVINRLQPVLRRRGLPDFRSYVRFLEMGSDPQASSELIDRISTNHTYFHREPAHFDYFRDEVLPGLVGRARSPAEKDLRVWCAAAATGEEPYTLMMLILDALGADYGSWKAGLLATDLSSDALAKAEAGVYDEEAVSQLPARLRKAHFEPVEGGRLRVRRRVRDEVVYRRFNLMTRRYPFRNPFHVIFCRNVMIYFDPDTKQRVVDRLYEVTADGGYLFVGHSEALDRSRCPYKHVHPGVYRRMTGTSQGEN
ncbi:MAG: protein-glutamate O-methyltransferase CheR [bacterium]|nr:protein-glutamate O-methyltransferase CheR [bacterium]